MQLEFDFSHGVTLDGVAEVVRRSRAEQGLPPTVTDPVVLSRLAAILGGSGGPTGHRKGTVQVPP